MIGSCNSSISQFTGSLPNRAFRVLRETVAGRAGFSTTATMKHHKYLELLFWSRVKVSKKHLCWNWQASKDRRGYGRLSRGGELAGKTIKSHRMSWELLNGKIPKNIHVLHRCNNPSCCNPFHLYIGTHKKNMSDALRDLRFKRGESRLDSKLTVKDVVEIRAKFIPFEYTIRMLAVEYGLSISGIANVVYRTAWKWVK